MVSPPLLVLIFFVFLWSLHDLAPREPAAMTEVRDLLLQALEADGEIADSQQFCIDKLIEHDAFVGALKSLQARSMVESSSSKTDKVVLSDQAKEIIEKGSPEARVWRAVPKGVCQCLQFVWRTTFCATLLVCNHGHVHETNVLQRVQHATS